MAEVDLIGRLGRLSQRPAHTVIGLMSGTSADGVDAALVRLEETSGRLKARIESFLTRPYPPELRRRVLEAAGADPVALARLDVQLGELFAEAVRAVSEAAGLDGGAIDLIGSHGQTVCHLPDDPDGRGCTLQVGSAAVLAERTGLPVVSDFRSRDMAAGGQGAPLVPLVDHLLFGTTAENRVLLNLGGLANITALNGNQEDLIAFDTGPANALMDALVRLATGGRELCDRDGRRAARGTADEAQLDRLLAHPFFERPPPRSADRELFGMPLARELAVGPLSLDDLLATAAALTARSVAGAILGLPAPFRSIDRVIASGGGVKNPVLMRLLSQALGDIPLETSDDHGIPAEAKEALAFAVLARETILGRPGNLPSATGASKRVVLGSITP